MATLNEAVADFQKVGVEYLGVYAEYDQAMRAYGEVFQTLHSALVAYYEALQRFEAAQAAMVSGYSKYNQLLADVKAKIEAVTALTPQEPTP